MNVILKFIGLCLFLQIAALACNNDNEKNNKVVGVDQSKNSLRQNTNLDEYIALFMKKNLVVRYLKYVEEIPYAEGNLYIVDDEVKCIYIIDNSTINYEQLFEDKYIDGCLKNIERLFLIGKNKNANQLPENVYKLNSLKFLDLRGSQLTIDFDKLTNLTKLSRLLLLDCKGKGDLNGLITKLDELKIIDLILINANEVTFNPLLLMNLSKLFSCQFSKAMANKENPEYVNILRTKYEVLTMIGDKDAFKVVNHSVK